MKSAITMLVASIAILAGMFLIGVGLGDHVPHPNTQHVSEIPHPRR